MGVSTPGPPSSGMPQAEAVQQPHPPRGPGPRQRFEEDDDFLDPNLDGNVGSELDIEVEATAQVGDTAQDTGDDDQGDNDGDDDDEDEDGPTMPECFANLTSEDITFYARILTRVGGPFMVVGDSADAGASWESECRQWQARQDVRAFASADDPDPRDLSCYEPDSRRLLENWNIICDVIPVFRQGIQYYVDQGRSVKRLKFCRAVQSAIGTVRGNDSTGIQRDFCGFVNPDRTQLTPPICLSSKTKEALRGWSHPTLAPMLLALRHEIMPENIALAAARDKSVATHEDAWPRWMYPLNQVYDPEAEENGLFRGYYVTHVLQRIYMSMESVGKKPDPHSSRLTRRSAAVRLGITRLTPRMVAYACCQAQFSINNQERWDEPYHDFDLEQFFWNIVTLLSTGTEGAQSMAYLNEQVFGEEVTATPERMSGANRLLAQRANATA